MASITSIHLPGRVRRYCSEPPLAFPFTEASNGGLRTACEMVLSVGCKLELLWALS